MTKRKSSGTLVENRRTGHDYNIGDTIEAGTVLQGIGIKSIHRDSANLKDSYAQVKNSEMYLNNMHVAPYKEGSRLNHDPFRPRKLSLCKREIIKLGDQTREIGYSAAPLELYLEHGHYKILLGVARGKREYDKRQALEEKAAKRGVARDMEAHY